MCNLITFDNGEDNPPVIQAIKDAECPAERNYFFNNDVLSHGPKRKNEVGNENEGNFFDVLPIKLTHIGNL